MRLGFVASRRSRAARAVAALPAMTMLLLAVSPGWMAGGETECRARQHEAAAHHAGHAVPDAAVAHAPEPEPCPHCAMCGVAAPCANATVALAARYSGGDQPELTAIRIAWTADDTGSPTGAPPLPPPRFVA